MLIYVSSVLISIHVHINEFYNNHIGSCGLKGLEDRISIELCDPLSLCVG